MTTLHGFRLHDGTSGDPTILLPPGEVGGLSFDLADVLGAIGERVARSEWRVEFLDCIGEARPELLAACEASANISGARLSELAARLVQVIDGDFFGREMGQTDPWVLVKAVDSCWWEVWSIDPGVGASLRRRFRAVQELTEDPPNEALQLTGRPAS
jgi:hypothetical protein